MNFQEEFEVFYKKHFKKAVDYASLQIPRPYAEDVVQDVFMEILEKKKEQTIANEGFFYHLLQQRINDAKRKYHVQRKHFIPSSEIYKEDEDNNEGGD
jgi:DNA-directed RNA polymerase specialized sigma24 family protein